MLDLILIIIFIASLMVGIKRGFVVQAIHLVSYFLSVLVAYIFYKPLADNFVLWIPYPGISEDTSKTLTLDAIDVDQTFYRIIAFAVIFFATKIVMQVIASIFDFLTYLPVLKSVNRLLGAFLCFIEFYLIAFIILYVSALLPLGPIQGLLGGSFIAGLMLEHTPLITSMFQNLWYIYTN
ncbi:MAG TPA: CvpA family protein [Ureibacillus sp.]|nr:CvpA family protein [Ureibacillus sp.]